MKMMSIDVLKKYLENLSIGADIIDKILKLFHSVNYKKNEYFSIAGDVSDKIGFVVKGLFFMHVIQDDGTLLTKDFIGNEQFALATFDHQKKCLANIQALKDSILLEARYSEIQLLLKKYPDINILAKKGMEKRLEYLYQRLENFAGMEAKDRYTIFKKEFSALEKDIPKYLVASYLGITPTQLSRIRNIKDK